MRYLSVLILVVTLIFSCQPNSTSENAKEGQESQQVEQSDSTIISAIKSYVTMVDESYSSRIQDVSLNPPIDNEKVVWIENDRGEYFKVIYAIQSEDPFFRHSFYIRNNEFAVYRYQTWLRTETPRKAKEIMCYINDGEIVKAYRKDLTLEGDERPVRMAKIPYEDAFFDRDSMMQVIESTYQLAMDKKVIGEQLKKDTTTQEMEKTERR